MNERTTVIHGGLSEEIIEGAVTRPVFHSTSYLLRDEADYKNIRYPRLSTTPNIIHLNKKMASLEGTESAMVFASGMGAITSALLAAVPHKGHLLIQSQLYGGTYHFIRDHFEEFGRSYTMFDFAATESLKSLIRPETKAIYIEACSNPSLRIPDFKKILDFAKANDLPTLIDNTFLSPVNFKPAALGFDIVLHSATKYLNGHTDVIAGTAAGSKTWMDRLRDQILILGNQLDSQSCFLLDRGLKTLFVRVEAQNKNAMKMAEYLESQKKIKKVYYPGLPSHPEYSRAREFFKGFGGMLSFDYNGSATETEAFMKKLHIPKIAPSLGGVETLISRPSSASHKALTPAERASSGVGESLVRLSVGIEDIQDLIEDFKQALYI